MRNRNNIFFTITTCLGLIAVSCDKYLEPEPDNRLTYDDVVSNAEFAEGWLLMGYTQLTTNYDFNDAIASDDAVTNNTSSNINNMNSGGWSSSQNPFSAWREAYQVLLNLNTLLSNVDDVAWFPSSESKNDLYRARIKGEAYGLRAWWSFMLLQNHAGLGTNGQILGFPIVDKVLSPNDNYELPRNTFKECVDFILADCDRAIQGLPDRWEDGSGDPDVDAVLGARNLNRISGLAVRLLKSRVALYAASPAYSQAGAATWQEAADMAAEVLTENGGLNLSRSDVTFYQNYQSQEIFWSSTNTPNKRNWEANNFPPSLFGNGDTNPSQNLVNAFGMADGMPIAISPDYDSNNPYDSRDPRLDKYIIVNNQVFGGKVIKTAVNSGMDALNSGINSTTTGYYIRKFMDDKVSLDPSGVVTGSEHFYTYARFTEALLNFAEAANEAGGPDANIGGYTPRDIINRIRDRSGINNTSYIDGISDKTSMRKVIKNERRIELCFEGFRFWDIRRWADTQLMKEDVKGIRISEDENTYNVFFASPRNYKDYQIYGPVPLSETQKYDLIQNTGW